MVKTTDTSIIDFMAFVNMSGICKYVSKTLTLPSY